MSSACKALTYTKMVEAEEKENMWYKKTVSYVINNYNRVRHTVMLTLKNSNQYKVDEIMSNLILYLKDASDYDISKAMNSENGNCISLEQYVNIGIKYCVQRYRSEEYKRSNNLVSVIKADDGTEHDILDKIPDTDTETKIENIGYNIDDMLDSIQGVRYKYGADLYLLVYIRLLTVNDVTETQDGGVYYTILESLGLSKKELNDTKKKINREPEVRAFVKSIVLMDQKLAIDKIEKYVYGHTNLRKAVEKLIEMQ